MGTTNLDALALSSGVSLTTGILGPGNLGHANFSQTGTISQTVAGTTNLTFTLPANAQLINILADVTVASDAVTSATLTVGTASAGTQYTGAVNVKTGGRTQPAFTAAQVASMANIGANTSVVATVVSVGTTSTGTTRVTVRYTVP